MTPIIDVMKIKIKDPTHAKLGRVSSRV